MTNTVALVFSGVGSVLGSRPEMSGQGARLRRLGVAGVLGGAVGGALLLATPADAFRLIVPWLVALGSVVILLRPRPAAPRHRSEGSSEGASGSGSESGGSPVATPP